jgi:hypothetical protein
MVLGKLTYQLNQHHCYHSTIILSICQLTQQLPKTQATIILCKGQLTQQLWDNNIIIKSAYVTDTTLILCVAELT